MRTIALVLLLLLDFTLKAQTPIFNLEDKDRIWEKGAYYKDHHNLLTPYVGTFIYTNDTISLKIVMRKKKEQHYMNYYEEDILIGEYEYKVRDRIIVSTLSSSSTDAINICGYSISGNTLLTNTNRPFCNECEANELRLRLRFSDKELELGGSMITRKTILNNQEAIKVFIRCEPQTVYYGDVLPPTQFRVPDGEYILIKQF